MSKTAAKSAVTSAPSTAKKAKKTRCTQEVFYQITDILKSNRDKLTGKTLGDIATSVKVYLPREFHPQVVNTALRRACTMANVSLSRNGHAEEHNKSCEQFTALCFAVFCEHSGVSVPPSVKLIMAGKDPADTNYQKELGAMMKAFKDRKSFKF